MDSQIISLNEELQDMREKYNELRNGNASKNNMNDDTPMCERLEANYIRSEDYQNQDSHNSFSRQSHHDPYDPEKSLTELNNDLKNDLKRYIRSMRTIHNKLFDRDDGMESPPELRRSWCVEEHIRLGVISSVLMQRRRSIKLRRNQDELDIHHR
ncbi:hypothetical protein Tco_0520362 [Tanacetum coccineum]